MEKQRHCEERQRRGNPGVMDCRASLSMNSFVIANAVKQSMTPDCMDCRASLAVTGTLFKGRVRYRAWYGWLAMTMSSGFKLREKIWR